MQILKRKIEAIMTKEDTAPFSSLLECILYLFSRAYEAIVRVRIFFYEKNIIKSKKLSCTVISIGNLTVGGTGKTPLTLYIADLLKRSGYRVVIVSRGYGGSAEKDGGIVSDGKTIRMTPGQAGDEPYLMATRMQGIPVIVGSNRYKAGKKALLAFNPDIVLLDDAFQHMRLKRDLNFCLCDAERPFGNGYLIPRGVLREPVEHLKRADAVVLTRDKGDHNLLSSRSIMQQYVPGKPVFTCSHVPRELKEAANGATHKLEVLRGQKILAFSGIAKNNDFAATLSELGGNILQFLPFSDHHQYSNDDVATIARTARRLNVNYIVTTEKDYVRIGNRLSRSFPTLVLMISISFGEKAETFEKFIKETLIASDLKTRETGRPSMC